MTTCGTRMNLLPLEAVPNDIRPLGGCSRFGPPSLCRALISFNLSITFIKRGLVRQRIKAVQQFLECLLHTKE